MEQPFEWPSRFKEDIKNEKPEKKSDTLAKEIHDRKLESIALQQSRYNEQVKQLKTFFPLRPLFLIANSSLGRTEITGSDLSGYRLEYRDSKLLEMFINGTILPEKNIYYADTENLREKDNLEQLVSIYNQRRQFA